MSLKIKLITNNYDFFIFDCDGVLIDSNEIKSDAFKYSLDGYPPIIVEDFIKYHKMNGGISRYVKLDYFFKNLLKIENYQADLKKVLNNFSQVSVSLIQQKAKLIPGVYNLLYTLFQEKKKIYVCSGAEETDLNKILHFKELDKFFNKIYGSPRTKSQIINEILNKNDLNDKKGLFFGDAFSDFDAARKNNLDFIFVSYNSEWAEGMQASYKEGFRSIFSYEDIHMQ